MWTAKQPAAASDSWMTAPVYIRCFCVFTSFSNFGFSYYYLNAGSHHIANVRLFYGELYFYFVEPKTILSKIIFWIILSKAKESEMEEGESFVKYGRILLSEVPGTLHGKKTFLSTSTYCLHTDSRNDPSSSLALVS